jgi:hypothetical protein
LSGVGRADVCSTEKKRPRQASSYDGELTGARSSTTEQRFPRESLSFGLLMVIYGSWTVSLSAGRMTSARKRAIYPSATEPRVRAWNPRHLGEKKPGHRVVEARGPADLSRHEIRSRFREGGRNEAKTRLCRRSPRHKRAFVRLRGDLSPHPPLERGRGCSAASW